MYFKMCNHEIKSCDFKLWLEWTSNWLIHLNLLENKPYFCGLCLFRKQVFFLLWKKVTKSSIHFILLNPLYPELKSWTKCSRGGGGSPPLPHDSTKQALALSPSDSAASVETDRFKCCVCHFATLLLSIEPTCMFDSNALPLLLESTGIILKPFLLTYEYIIRVWCAVWIETRQVWKVTERKCLPLDYEKCQLGPKGEIPHT